MLSSFIFFFNDTATTEIYTSFPTRRSSDLNRSEYSPTSAGGARSYPDLRGHDTGRPSPTTTAWNYQTFGPAVVVGEGRRSEEHTSELQSHLNLVCRLLLEKKKKINMTHHDP